MVKGGGQRNKRFIYCEGGIYNYANVGYSTFIRLDLKNGNMCHVYYGLWLMFLVFIYDNRINSSYLKFTFP